MGYFLYLVPVWEHWSPWSSCSVSCGSGTQIKTRQCRTSNCEGRTNLEQKCNVQACGKICFLINKCRLKTIVFKCRSISVSVEQTNSA